MCGAPSTVYTPGHIFAVLKALRRSLQHRRHHAVVLTELICYLDNLLDQEGVGRHRAEHVQNVEVPYIRCLIGRNEKKLDYINRVVKRFRFWSTRVHGHTIPLSLLCIS